MTKAPLSRPGFSFQFQSSDLDEFREMIERSIRPCEFRARAARYDARLSHNRVGDVGFSVVSVGPDMKVTVEPVEDSYLIQTALAGSFGASCLEPLRVFEVGDLNIVSPTAPLHVSMHPGTRLLLTRIAKSAVDEQAQILIDATGTGGLRPIPESSSSAGSRATSLRRYLQFLHAESLAPGSVLHHGTGIRSAEQMLISLMLALDEGDSDSARSSLNIAGHLRRAEEFIDGHADDDIGIVDIARAAGVDARTLAEGLHRRRGAGPLAWLEQRRAERSERAAGDPSPLTPRELEIARLVAAGLNNGEIGSCLEISRNTVKEALKRIFRKMEVDSRSELVARLAETGLLET
jgi:DNA-binding CsgD family transcriptional regulator